MTPHAPKIVSPPLSPRGLQIGYAGTLETAIREGRLDEEVCRAAIDPFELGVARTTRTMGWIDELRRLGNMAPSPEEDPSVWRACLEIARAVGRAPAGHRQ